MFLNFGTDSIIRICWKKNVEVEMNFEIEKIEVEKNFEAKKNFEAERKFGS